MELGSKKLLELSKACAVLFVEDEAQIAEQTVDFLKKFFPVVDYACNGKEGLEMYQANQYELVITDISMPVMNGIDMISAIREINPEQDVMIISAYNDFKYATEAIRLGVDGYVLKPVEFDSLIHELARVVRKIMEHKENIEYKKHLEKMVEDKTEQLRRKYITDDLTGLYNRVYLKESLATDSRYALILMNIDNFGIINDSYGMDFGDKVIVEISRFLKQIVPNDDLLFRLNGDEFALLIHNPNGEEAYERALEIRAFFMEEPIELQELEVKVSFTMGIDTGAGYDLLKNCSLSVREIRELGRNRIQVYQPDSLFEKKQKENIEWIERIKKGLYEEQFIPYFQPIISNQTGKIDKYECLARLQEGDDIISPGLFIGPAKIAGLLSSITRQMIDKSFKYLQGSQVHFSINIADYDLREGFLIPFLEQKLKIHHIDPKNVVLEILESISVQDTHESIEQLGVLKKMGFKIAIDDFGTESSNYSRLLDLDVDFIKIDGSFIKDLEQDVNSQKITESIVRFARSIDSKVIAEFVHNEGVQHKVAAYGIDYSQGYFFGPPQEKIDCF